MRAERFRERETGQRNATQIAISHGCPGERQYGLLRFTVGSSTYDTSGRLSPVTQQLEALV